MEKFEDTKEYGKRIKSLQDLKHEREKKIEEIKKSCEKYESEIEDLADRICINNAMKTIADYIEDIANERKIRGFVKRGKTIYGNLVDLKVSLENLWDAIDIARFEGET